MLCSVNATVSDCAHVGLVIEMKNKINRWYWLVQLIISSWNLDISKAAAASGKPEKIRIRLTDRELAQQVAFLPCWFYLFILVMNYPHKGIHSFIEVSYQSLQKKLLTIK